MLAGTRAGAGRRRASGRRTSSRPPLRHSRRAGPWRAATPPIASSAGSAKRVHRRTRRGKAGGTGVEALTERELEVARLIVDRRTNAQIAAELFLSPKTVETHVRHLFQKLEVSSRVEVARVVERAEREPLPR